MDNEVRDSGFIQDILKVCEKHNLTLVPEDNQVCLEIELYTEDNIEYLLNAGGTLCRKQFVKIKIPFKRLHEYEQDKQVTLDELEKYFKAVSSTSGNFNMKFCPKCHSDLNSTILPSEPWSTVRYCWHCKSIFFLAIQDRMSGVSEDQLIEFKEKIE